MCVNKYNFSLWNKAERAFAAQKEAEGKTWFWQPKVFRLPPPLNSYRPDFYVIEDASFYEIVGTRQAYSFQLARIGAFRAAYPSLRLEVVNCGAWQCGPRGPRKPVVQGDIRKATLTTTLKRIATKRRLNLPPSAQEMLRIIESSKCRTLTEFALLADLAPPTISSILYGYYEPTPRILEKVRRLDFQKSGGTSEILTLARK